MISRRVKVLSRSSEHTNMIFETPCLGCKQFCKKQIKLSLHKSFLPSSSASHIEFSINMNSQLSLLLNSLLLPLLGFVLGAVVAESLGSAEVQVILCSMIGLIIGILLCRKISISCLKIKEVL
ncbi:MAG: hypothetical protein ACI9CE_002583 [Flavobacterium sp.]|jgi:hypothetical protein